MIIIWGVYQANWGKRMRCEPIQRASDGSVEVHRNCILHFNCICWLSYITFYCGASDGSVEVHCNCILHFKYNSLYLRLFVVFYCNLLWCIVMGELRRLCELHCVEWEEKNIANLMLCTAHFVCTLWIIFRAPLWSWNIPTAQSKVVYWLHHLPLFSWKGIS